MFCGHLFWSSLTAGPFLQHAATFLLRVVQCCSWDGCYTTCPSTSWAEFSTITTTSLPCSSAVCLQVLKMRKYSRIAFLWTWLSDGSLGKTCLSMGGCGITGIQICQSIDDGWKLFCCTTVRFESQVLDTARTWPISHQWERLSHLKCFSPKRTYREICFTQCFNVFFFSLFLRNNTGHISAECWSPV